MPLDTCPKEKAAGDPATPSCFVGPKGREAAYFLASSSAPLAASAASLAAPAASVALSAALAASPSAAAAPAASAAAPASPAAAAVASASAFGGFHRAVSSAFDGCSGVFGGCSGVVGGLFGAGSEAQRSGEDERQSDRFLHIGNTPSRFWTDRSAQEQIDPETAQSRAELPLAKYGATPFFDRLRVSS